MASTSDLLASWPSDRLCNIDNRCPCHTCCVSSNICAHPFCRDWTCTIDWKSTNPPQLRCASPSCFNAYHLVCLPYKYRLSSSWRTCADLGTDFSCSSRRSLFSLARPLSNKNSEHEANEALITAKYGELFPHKRLRIREHFVGFHLN